MSMLVKVYSCLLTDTSRLTGVHLDLPDTLDVTWVLIEAPRLDKALLQWIEGNEATLPLFPEWLMPLVEKFISSRDALILRCLRTILVFGYKAEHEPTKEQLQEAQKAFCDANTGVAAWNACFVASSPAVTFREARRLIGHVIGRINWTEVIPKHGPGAVYPSSKPCNKGNFNVCTPIVEYYPYDTLFNALPETGRVDLMMSDYFAYDQIVCKMVAVPKDSRGPRLISVHPKEAIWVQQGQRKVLETRIANHPLTRGRINFRDQTVNGKLALSSSGDGLYCTIDLKEASDRIGKALVAYLFGYASKVLGCSRAGQVLMLDGSLVDLEMWAPMGNCLTFPVESLVFWALARAGIRGRHGVICDDVYVFGDDILVPTKYYDGAIWGLVQAGLIPNFNKTFRKGLFRESCGVDAYNGKDVTPHRIKCRDVVSYSDAESVCDLAKRLRQADYADTSAWLYSKVSRKFGRLSLTNNPHCQGLIEYTNYDLATIFRYEPRVLWDTEYHKWVVPFRRRVRTIEVLTYHAWWHVQDSLLSLHHLDEEPPVDEFRDIPTIRQLNNDRGLEYPSPRGERLYRGLCDLMHD